MNNEEKMEQACRLWLHQNLKAQIALGSRQRAEAFFREIYMKAATETVGALGEHAEVVSALAPEVVEKLAYAMHYLKRALVNLVPGLPESERSNVEDDLVHTLENLQRLENLIRNFGGAPKDGDGYSVPYNPAQVSVSVGGVDVGGAGQPAEPMILPQEEGDEDGE